MPPGSVYRINTGAPLPVGTDAVLMVEDTRLHSTDANEEESEVEALAQVDPGENTRKPGSDVRKDDLAVEKGTIIHGSGGEIGTLAFVGRQTVSSSEHHWSDEINLPENLQVRVHAKPVVAVLSTGNELLDIQTPQKIEGDGWGGIWDTNRPSLQAALEGMGYEVIYLGIVADE